MREICFSWSQHIFQNFKETFNTFAECNKKQSLCRWPSTTTVFFWNIRERLPDEFRVSSIAASDDSCPLDVTHLVKVS